MNLFDNLVDEVLAQQPDLTLLRPVVEKELLHHDILRTLSEHHFLQNLTFIGGTCLRSCYGSQRLSEDLDFTGGHDFNRESLSAMGDALTANLEEKYNLKVTVTAPIKDTGNVDTWKIKIETKPEQKHLPAQRININICAVESYDIKPMLLLNPYNVDMGTSGLILQAESRAEIYTDKLLAFALRPNRLKNRDLWDIVWLHQQNIKPDLTLIDKKLAERSVSIADFLHEFGTRCQLLANDSQLSVEFNKEMQRFLSVAQQQLLQQNNFWDFIVYLLTDWHAALKKHFK